jgi:hypothetical protein
MKHSPFLIPSLILLCISFSESSCFAFQVPRQQKASSTTTRRIFNFSQTVIENNTLFKSSTHNRKTRLMSKKMDDSIEGDTDVAPWMWFVTLVLPLQLVYVSNQWSRSSIYYLVNFSEDADPFRAMNLDIGFSQAQYGLLASLAFTALFAVASLGAGIASDRYNRKNLTIFAAIGWSVATLGTSLSSSYSEVLGWRVAMGLACAFATPTAYTLINERVPKDQTAFATSLYGTGGELFVSLLSFDCCNKNGCSSNIVFVLFSCFWRRVGIT